MVIVVVIVGVVVGVDLSQVGKGEKTTPEDAPSD
jgi:predicted metalloprotease